jgi:hypothetical protein
MLQRLLIKKTYFMINTNLIGELVGGVIEFKKDDELDFEVIETNLNEISINQNILSSDILERLQEVSQFDIDYQIQFPEAEQLLREIDGKLEKLSEINLQPYCVS